MESFRALSLNMKIYVKPATDGPTINRAAHRLGIAPSLA